MNVGDYLAFQTHSESWGRGNWYNELYPRYVSLRNTFSFMNFELTVFVPFAQHKIRKASFGWRVKRLKQ